MSFEFPEDSKLTKEEKAQIDELKKLHMLYLQVFDSDNGRKVLEDLEKRCYVRGTTFVPGEPYQTFFNEGARSCVLHIKTMMVLPTIKKEEAANGQS